MGLLFKTGVSPLGMGYPITSGVPPTSIEKNQGIQPRTAQAATQEKKDIGDIGVKQTLKVIFGSKPSNYFASYW